MRERENERGRKEGTEGQTRWGLSRPRTEQKQHEQKTKQKIFKNSGVCNCTWQRRDDELNIELHMKISAVRASTEEERKKTEEKNEESHAREKCATPATYICQNEAVLSSAATTRSLMRSDGEAAATHRASKAAEQMTARRPRIIFFSKLTKRLVCYTTDPDARPTEFSLPGSSSSRSMK